MKSKYKKISYDNITVDQYQKMHNIKDIDQLISILHNININDIELIDMVEYNQLLESLDGFKKNLNKNYKYLQIDDTYFYYKPIKYITFGEYLDCIEYIKGNNVAELIAVFYRMAEERKFDSLKFEPYTFDMDTRSKYFKDIKSTYFFQIKRDLEHLDKVINTNFKLLFDSDNEKNEKEDISELSGRDKAMFLHQQKIKQSYNDRAWEYVVYALAQKDINKLDDVYNLSLFKVLNFLSFEKELDLRNKSNKKSK